MSSMYVLCPLSLMKEDEVRLMRMMHDDGDKKREWKQERRLFVYIRMSMIGKAWCRYIIIYRWPSLYSLHSLPRTAYACIDTSFLSTARCEDDFCIV